MSVDRLPELNRISEISTRTSQSIGKFMDRMADVMKKPVDIVCDKLPWSIDRKTRELITFGVLSTGTIFLGTGMFILGGNQ